MRLRPIAPIHPRIMASPLQLSSDGRSLESNQDQIFLPCKPTFCRYIDTDCNGSRLCERSLLSHRGCGFHTPGDSALHAHLTAIMLPAAARASADDRP